MDVEEVWKNAQASFDRAKYRQNLKMRLEKACLFPYAGGLWKADMNLMSGLKTFKELNQTKTWLVDINSRIVQVDVEPMLDLALKHYQSALEILAQEQEETDKIRR